MRKMGMILITGGSGSGKSAFAEEIIRKQARRKDLPLYYLATMQVYGDEGRQKVERHRKMRAGKGFETVEQPRDIIDAAKRMKGSAALLECVSNLTANEMFLPGKTLSADAVTEKVSSQILELNDHLDTLAVVTNNVFEDGIRYEETTRNYLLALGKINRILAAQAAEVWEVTAGIPVCIKEGNA